MWTLPPERILVPIDFGDAASDALRLAGALAARHRSLVTALHAEAIEVPAYFTHDQLQAVERHRLAARADAVRFLETYVTERGVAASARIVDGPPDLAILAASADADLIVMGTHGRRGPSRWWAGSVAERVVRSSETPVLVVRAGSVPLDPRALFEHVVAVAGPEFSDAARAYVSHAARSFGGTLESRIVVSPAELAGVPSATLMAIAVGQHQGSSWFGDAGERLVRLCAIPMLFIPAAR
jgi:nucleotide-binding universal stress UspA family protein